MKNVSSYTNLRLAAKAAGLVVVGEDQNGLLIQSDGCKSGYGWNPEHSDADAFQLACEVPLLVIHPVAGDRKSTRAAILNASVDIQKAREALTLKYKHVCGLQGFGALDDHCPACSNKE